MSDSVDLTLDDGDDHPSRQRADSLLTPPSSRKRSVHTIESTDTIVLDTDDEGTATSPMHPPQKRSGSMFQSIKPKDLTPQEVSAELVAAARERRIARQSEQRKRLRVDVGKAREGSQASRSSTASTGSIYPPNLTFGDDEPDEHTLTDRTQTSQRNPRYAQVPELHNRHRSLASRSPSTPKTPSTPKIRKQPTSRKDREPSSAEWQAIFSTKHAPFTPRNPYMTPPRQMMREPPATPWAPSVRNKENGFRTPSIFKSFDEFNKAANAHIEIQDAEPVIEDAGPVEPRTARSMAPDGASDGDGDGMDEWYAPASPSTIPSSSSTKRQEQEQQKIVAEHASVKATDTWSADDLFSLADDVAKSFDWVDFAARHEKTCDEVADVLEEVVTKPLAEVARMKGRNRGGKN
ncbi:hypothetical protein LTS18_004232 [Coniosporium uncinatum]|uniref:Uncharacterized protein n=1 Tax=Coniosporium uncinatum TaxID=93489 RepID=A0ACC3E093_9PEZI|nr:hypothetical protein LTS18_004232 [Coniosporium uncinatum]